SYSNLARALFVILPVLYRARTQPLESISQLEMVKTALNRIGIYDDLRPCLIKTGTGAAQNLIHFNSCLLLQFDRLSVAHNRRQIVGSAIQSIDQLSDGCLFVGRTFTLLNAAPQKRGIEFETVKLVLEVVNYLH